MEEVKVDSKATTNTSVVVDLGRIGTAPISKVVADQMKLDSIERIQQIQFKAEDCASAVAFQNNKKKHPWGYVYEVQAPVMEALKSALNELREERSRWMKESGGLGDGNDFIGN